MLEKSVRIAMAGKQCLTSVFMCAQCLSSVSAFLKLLKEQQTKHDIAIYSRLSRLHRFLQSYGEGERKKKKKKTAGKTKKEAAVCTQL